MSRIPFSEIENAFLFVSSGPYGMNSALLNRVAGQIFYSSEMGDIDEIGEEETEVDVMVEIPHKNDLDLGTQLVFEFASEHLPDEYGRVRDMFRGRGAYARWKHFLGSKGLLEAWYRFDDEREKDALRRWCEEEGLAISD